MIITIFISMVSFLTQGILAVLPVGSLDPNFSLTISYVVFSMNAVNYIIPVSDILNCLYIVVAFEIAVWAFDGALWIWRRLPFIGR